MRISKILLLILVFATIASCNSLFNSDEHGPELNLLTTRSPSQTTTFNGDTLVFVEDPDLYDQPPGEYEFPEFTSKIQNKQIVINGYYLASSSFIPEGIIKQDGDKITIYIQMPENKNYVPNMPEGYFYDAYISNLSSKTYTVEIVHRNDGLRGKDGEATTVFTKKFDIK